MIAERAHTVLIVEDETLLRVLLAEFLAGCGFDIIDTATADDAVEILAKPDIVIDIIFTDVRMPGHLDGFGLARWVRENRPDLPVLIASGDIGIANLTHQLCASEKFLTKPYDLDSVEDHIRQSIAWRKSA